MLLEFGLAVVLGAQPPAEARPSPAPEPQTQTQTVPKVDESQSKKPPTPAHTGIRALFGNLGGDYTHLPHKDNLLVAALGAGLALGAHPFDQGFNVRLRSHYTTVNRAFAPGKYFGNTPEQVVLSLGTYAYGRMTTSPKASHFGMDLLRAQIVTESIVQPIKFGVRRERPDGSNRHSFPSGHAAITFAGATVVERHLGWKQSALAYLVASYVAASRLHDNRHYLSDVTLGAAIGTIVGRTVTQHGRSYWTLLPTRVPGGVALVVARNFEGQD